MNHRVFTPEEANRTLPLVRRIVSDIRARYQDLFARKDALFEIASRQPSSLSEADRQRMQQLQDELAELAEQANAYLEELRRIGCEMRDPRRGLVDFLCRQGARLVCLCWLDGEAEVQHWHELDAGFEGRQPLSSLKLPGP